jgi:tRNA G26 N,N-dimethylase Trm1
MGPSHECLHLDANSQIIQLELKLTGSVSLWYEQLSPLKKTNTTTILEELLTKFNTLDHREALLTQLDKLKQNKKTIEEYAYELQHLCKEINSKIEDEEKLRRFINDLNFSKTRTHDQLQDNFRFRCCNVL